MRAARVRGSHIDERAGVAPRAHTNPSTSTSSHPGAGRASMRAAASASAIATSSAVFTAAIPSSDPGHFALRSRLTTANSGRSTRGTSRTPALQAASRSPPASGCGVGSTTAVYVSPGAHGATDVTRSGSAGAAVSAAATRASAARASTVGGAADGATGAGDVGVAPAPAPAAGAARGSSASTSSEGTLTGASPSRMCRRSA